MRILSKNDVTFPASAPQVLRDEVAADVLAKLLRAPDELRRAGAPPQAIAAAEEIARMATLLLAGKTRH
jgi:hypothetical protein